MTINRKLGDTFLKLKQWIHKAWQKFLTISPKKLLLNCASYAAMVITLFFITHWYQTRNSLLSEQDSQIPNFVLPSLGDITIESSDLLNKPTVVYFFATWCSICNLSMKNLKGLESDWKAGKVDVVLIALDWQSKSSVEKFIHEKQLHFPVLLGNNTTQRKFKIKGFPTYFIADERNVIQYMSVGYSTSLGLKARLKLL